GLVADFGLSHTLPRIAGGALAADMLMTGRRLDAAAALAAGLVSRVVEDPDAEAQGIARTLATWDAAARIKAQVAASASVDLTTALSRVEVETQAAALSDPAFSARARAWITTRGR
ncbi:MAG: enoyl-CoA hydratase, partial [Solirubrobacterales bacterium]|nr:enoyl-CoA hydratase [Solirubrobacterales bacterium]